MGTAAARGQTLETGHTYTLSLCFFTDTDAPMSDTDCTAFRRSVRFFRTYYMHKLGALWLPGVHRLRSGHTTSVQHGGSDTTLARAQRWSGTHEVTAPPTKRMTQLIRSSKLPTGQWNQTGKLPPALVCEAPGYNEFFGWVTGGL